VSTDAASRLVSQASTNYPQTAEHNPNRNCDSRRKDIGFDYKGEFKRKRNMSGQTATNNGGSRRFMKSVSQYNAENGGGGGQSNFSFFQVADCISEEAE
jgi:hypothetical protein